MPGDPPQDSTDSLDGLKSAAEFAVPEFYDLNAFRLLELPVECTERDLSRRREWMEKAARNKLPVPPGPARLLPRIPAPDDHEVRLCAHAVQDAERRLLHEFFWFWPLQSGQAGGDTALRALAQGDRDEACRLWLERDRADRDDRHVARHNLAIFHHWAALELERAFLREAPPSRPAGARPTPTVAAVAEEKTAAAADAHWREAGKYWKAIGVEQGFWTSVAARIRALEDKSLTTGAARRLERHLPVMLTLIDARLAIRAWDNGQALHAQRHVARIRAAGFEKKAIEEGLRIAIEPTRALLKPLCVSADKESDAHPEKGDAIAERLLGQSARPLAILAMLLPETHPAHVAERDQVALAALGCVIAFCNKTEKWKRADELLARLESLAASETAKERVKTNREAVAPRLTDGTCWFCGQNEADETCGFQVAMYGDVERTPTFNGERVTWRHGKVTVPLCRLCQKEGQIEGLGAGIIFVFVVLGLVNIGVVHAFANDLAGPGAEGSGLGFGLAVCIALIVWGCKLSSSLKKRHLRPGLKKRKRDDHPQIQAHLKRGWSFGSGPSGN